MLCSCDHLAIHSTHHQSIQSHYCQRDEYWRAPPWHASIPSIPGHNASGREFLRTHGNHLETQSHYDPQGRLMVQTTLKQQANPGRPLDPISQRHYHYNTQGQLSQIDDRHKGQTHYHYDALGRRIEKATATRTTTFCWDGKTCSLKLIFNYSGNSAPQWRQ